MLENKQVSRVFGLVNSEVSVRIFTFSNLLRMFKIRAKVILYFQKLDF